MYWTTDDGAQAATDWQLVNNGHKRKLSSNFEANVLCTKNRHLGFDNTFKWLVGSMRCLDMDVTCQELPENGTAKKTRSFFFFFFFFLFYTTTSHQELFLDVVHTAFHHLFTTQQQGSVDSA